MTKSLTQTLKQKYLPILIKRDKGFVCLYCKEQLTDEYIFEHLDDNRNHNEIENIVLAHQSCNIKKIDYIEYGLVAEDKLKENQEMGLYYLEDESAHEQNSSEIEINKALFNFTEQYIAEKIVTDVNISFDDAITELPYLCQKRFGHGSEQSVRRYVKQLTCKASEWQVVRDDKNKKIICKRNVLN